MLHIRSIFVLLCLCFFSLSTLAQNLLVEPESVVYDQVRNRYLVSNYNNGAIVQIDSEGVQSYYDTTLIGDHNIVGMHIKDEVLYVASNTGPYSGIVAFDLESAEMLTYYEIEYEGLLNDITTDTSGYLYVTDYWDNKLFKVNIETQEYSLFIDGGMGFPNGIWYDEWNHRLLVCSVMGYGTPILAVNLEDSTFTVAAYTWLGGMDGITMDDDARVYVSEWTDNSVWRLNADLTGLMQFSAGHDAPADIYIDRVNDVLAVPNFYRNTVDFVPVPGVKVENRYPFYPPSSVYLFPVNPNPFNASAVIKYRLDRPMQVKLSVYNQLGHEAAILIDRTMEAGEYQASWNAEGFSSGVYYVNLTTPEAQKTERIVFVK